MAKVVPLRVDRESRKRGHFRAGIDVRWSDIDNQDRINHASVVALLKEARNRWLFGPGAPNAVLEPEWVTAEMHLEYRRQLEFEDSPLEIVMWADRIGADGFTIAYEVRPAGSSDDDAPAVTATTRLLAVDFATQHERQLTNAEREYLRRWQRGPDPSSGWG